MNYDVFKHYPNKYFVETGSCIGAGIEGAIKAGFPNVISVESLEEFHFICKRKFADNPTVRLVLGDSPKVLPDILSAINDPITFWLDAHYSGGCYYKEENREILTSSENPSPIMDELRVIAAHPLKSHTILIDDYFYFGHTNNLAEALWSINPNYRLSLIDGTRTNDIILATL